MFADNLMELRKYHSLSKEELAEKIGISFHLFYLPLTNTASSSVLPVTKEFMASPQKVWEGLAKHIDSKKFVIWHSFSQAMQRKICYRHPLFMCKMMWKMTTRANQSNKK